MPVNPKLLDLWERELKLRARMAEVELTKKELTPLIRCSCNSPGTMFREKMQRREQDLLRELHSVVAHRERIEESEKDDDWTIE